MTHATHKRESTRERSVEKQFSVHSWRSGGSGIVNDHFMTTLRRRLYQRSRWRVETVPSFPVDHPPSNPAGLAFPTPILSHWQFRFALEQLSQTVSASIGESVQAKAVVRNSFQSDLPRDLQVANLAKTNFTHWRFRPSTALPRSTGTDVLSPLKSNSERYPSRSRSPILSRRQTGFGTQDVVGHRSPNQRS